MKSPYRLIKNGLWGCLFLSLTLFVGGSTSANGAGLSFSLPIGETSYEYLGPVTVTQEAFSGVITRWELGDEADDHSHEAVIYFKNRELSGEWSDWTPVLNDLGDEAGENHSELEELSSLLTTNLSNEYQYKVLLSEQTPEINNLSFEFINIPGEQTTTVASESYLIAGLQPSPLLDVIPRTTWGAVDSYNYTDSNVSNSIDESIDGSAAGKTDIGSSDNDIKLVIEQENGHDLLWPYQYASNIRYMVIHHTVSSSENPEQAIRNIQYYHAVSRGWGDIGYNYVVDQQGRIYEGRKGGEGVIGGHSIPVNKTSIGIAVLGDFQSNTPPPAVTEALTKILANKADLYGLNPNGFDVYKDNSYPVISGHRDTDATACPGDYLYETIPALRSLVKQQMDLLSGITPDVENLDPIPEIVEINPLSSKQIEIKLRNNTNETWNYQDTFLSSSSSDYIDFDLELQAPSTFKSKVGTLKTNQNIAPGEIGTFVILAKTGLKGGFASIELKPVINSKSTTYKFYLPIHAQEALFQFELSGIQNTQTLEGDAGDQQNLSFKLTNRSNFTWSDSIVTKVYLGMDQPRDLDSELLVTSSNLSTGRIWELKQALAPGQSVTVNLTAVIPEGYGTYREVYRPVINAYKWADGAPLTLNYSLEPVRTGGFLGEGSALSRFLSLGRLLDLKTEQAGTIGGGVDSEDIRIHLSAFKESSTNVSLNDNYKLYVGGKLYRLVRRFDSLQIVKDDKNPEQVGVFVNDIYYSGSTVKLEPFESETGIVELVDMDQRPAWNRDLNDNRFRDSVEFRIDNQNLIAINELPLGYYLLGVAETSNGAASELQKTMNILARTYAAYYLEPTHTKFSGKPYDLDDSPARSQRYLGYGFEARSPKAVESFKAVSDMVVTFEGNIAITPYFSRSDGRTKSAEEVWGWDWAPYLQSVPDTYCSDSDTKPAAGHGVGLSGCGAAGMANSGKSYSQIIDYFYQGVEIERY